MNMQLTIKAALELAIQKEIEAQTLYTRLSQLVENPATKEAFQELVQQEKGHQHLLEGYQRGELKQGALRPEHVLDYKIAEYSEQPQISSNMELKDTFLLAANREKASHEFYLCLARIHPNGKVRSLLEGLATQELEHKRIVESLYTEVAFPQTDGG